MKKHSTFESKLPADFGDTHLRIDENATEAQFEQVRDLVLRSQGAGSFWIGDLSLAAEASKGKAFEESLFQGKVAKQTRYNARLVCKVFPPPDRFKPHVSFAHYVKAYNACEQKVELARKYLAEAEVTRISSQKMKEKIERDLGTKKPGKTEFAKAMVHGRSFARFVETDHLELTNDDRAEIIALIEAIHAEGKRFVTKKLSTVSDHWETTANNDKQTALAPAGV